MITENKKRKKFNHKFRKKRNKNHFTSSPLAIRLFAIIAIFLNKLSLQYN